MRGSPEANHSVLGPDTRRPISSRPFVPQVERSSRPHPLAQSAKILRERVKINLPFIIVTTASIAGGVAMIYGWAQDAGFTK